MSRETRRLLAAGALAVAALWVLARIRFEERAVTPNPVPAVFSQLGAPPSYDELAETVVDVQARLASALLAFDARTAEVGVTARRAALRLRDDLAVVVLPDASTVEAVADTRILARDPATGLAVVRVSPGNVLTPAAWTPRRAQQPRYLFTSDVSAAGVSVRPVFVGALAGLDSPWWPEPVWAVPAGTGLAPGAFVFTSNAELVGLVAAGDTGLVIVPGATALAAAARLVDEPGPAPGWLGIEVQALTAPVAALTGATRGVVVTRVQPPPEGESPVRVGDVIEDVNGQPVRTRQHWDARSLRVREGEALVLRVRRGGATVSVTLTATPSPQQASRELGLVLRRIPDAGAEATRVERGAAAERAGLRIGDVITRVAGMAAPTPAQVARVFAGLEDGQRVMLAVTRGDAHHVLVLER